MDALRGLWIARGAVAGGDGLVASTATSLGAGPLVDRVRFGGETTDTGTFSLDGSTEEKTMLLRGVEGPNAGRAIPGIYQRTGNRLRVCYGLDGVAPAELKTSRLNARYLAMYRRRTEKG